MPTVVQLVSSGLPLCFFQRAGAYWVVIANTDVQAVQCYSSSDGGATWSQIGGNSPTAGAWPDQAMVAVWDEADTVTMFYLDGFFVGNSYLVQFDLAAGTWGARFAELSGEAGGDCNPAHIFVNSTGGFAVVFSDNDAPDNPIYTRTWNGSSWSAAVNVSTNVQALPGYDPANSMFVGTACALDSSDVLHCLMLCLFDPALYGNFFYQEITLGGSLQNFQRFPNQLGPTPDLYSIQTQPASALLIDGSSLYWGIQRNNYGSGPNPFAAIYVGTPLINPVWTETGNIDPGASDVQYPFFNPVLQKIGSTLYASFIRSNPLNTGQQVETVFSSDGFATSTAETLTDSTEGGPTVANYGPFLLSGLLLATGGVPVEGGPLTPGSFTRVGNPPPPVAIKITLRGVKRIRCQPPDISEMPPPLPSVDRAV